MNGTISSVQLNIIFAGSGAHATVARRVSMGMYIARHRSNSKMVGGGRRQHKFKIRSLT